MKKRVLIIASLVMALALSFVAFSYTMDELKQVFVTRDEFDIWANSDCGVTNTSGQPIGMSEYLASVEQNKIMSVNLEAGYQMFRREILSNEAMSKLQSESPSVYESWSRRRSEELSSIAAASPVFGAPMPTTVVPEETASPSDAS